MSMPTYDYRCTDCSHDFSIEATVAEYENGLDARCPSCHSGEVTRRLGSVLISMGASDAGDAPQGRCCTPSSGCC